MVGLKDKDNEKELLFEDACIYGFWVIDKDDKRVPPEEYLRKVYKSDEDVQEK